MTRYGNRILIVFLPVLFLGLLPAQQRVQETRLLNVQPTGKGFRGAGFLGSKIFAYTQFHEGIGINLFRLEGEREVAVLKQRHGVGIGEYITRIEVARDDSRIVFGSSGDTHHYPTAIFSVRPDGSQLTKLIVSGSDCDKTRSTGYGPSYCNFPYGGRISPDGQKILFFNKVLEWNEETKVNDYNFYLSLMPAGGGPVVRLEEIGPGRSTAVWSKDGRSIYYCSSRSSDETWNYVPRRYDLETGRSEFLIDEAWKALPPLAGSRADGALYFRSNQGFVRLDPETREVEVIVEERFDTFDLSPDGRRAVGLKEGAVTIVDLGFPSSSPLQRELGVVDELELGKVSAAREKMLVQMEKTARSASAGIPKWLQSRAVEEVLGSIGIQRIRWLDNERLWCVLGEHPAKVRVGTIRLTN